MPKYSITELKLREAHQRDRQKQREASKNAYVSRNERPYSKKETASSPTLTAEDIARIFRIKALVRKNVVIVDDSANGVISELQQFCRQSSHYLFTTKFEVNWAFCQGPKRITPLKGYEITITDTRGAFAQVRVDGKWHELILATSYSTPGGVLWSPTCPMSQLLSIAQQLEFELEL